MNRLIVLVSFVMALVFPGLLVAQDIPCAEYIHDEPRFTACYQQYVMNPELLAENTHKAMPRIPIELAPAIVGAAAGQVTPHGALDIADLTLRFIAGMPSFAERVTFRPPLVGYSTSTFPSTFVKRMTATCRCTATTVRCGPLPSFRLVL